MNNTGRFDETMLSVWLERMWMKESPCNCVSTLATAAHGVGITDQMSL